METKAQQIGKLKRTWGNRCAFCGKPVADLQAFPLSTGVAHKRCFTQAVLDAK